jgi:hypothetical protein
MTKANVYRLRAKGVERRRKKATKTDKAVMAKKEGLNDMVDNEDRLDGKPKAKNSRFEIRSGVF